jgi:UV DNA damage endonuclease
MRKAIWEERGLPYASELAIENVRDLLTILRWNEAHDIGFYRCTSNLVPWNSQFDLTELPDYREFERLARQCGTFIEKHGMRLTFHPDYWCKLASTSDDTVARSIDAVEYHASWLDAMGLGRRRITESTSTLARPTVIRPILANGFVRLFVSCHPVLAPG